MKITAPASALTAALGMTAPASVAIKLKTDRKPPPDVQVQIVAVGDIVNFTVSNPRAGVTISASTAAKVTVPGKAATSATRLIALLGAFAPGSTIDISTDGIIIQVSSKASCYRLPTLPDPPTAFAIKGEIGRVELPRANCLRLLEALPAVATEQSRNYLCGVHLRSVEDQLVAVATDGTTLLTIGVAADHFSDHDGLIIPTPTATMLRRLLRQAKTESVTLRRSRGLFSVTSSGSFELVTALIEGSYPDYRRVMPRAVGNSATCQRAELLGALARLQAVASGLVRLSRLSWEEGGTELLISLPQQPLAGLDTLAALTSGRASMAFDLAQLITEFDNEAVHLAVTDRGLLIHQVNKIGVLASCRWQDTANDAAA
jgi:DNA polymerase III sliding clamp (beta) subunit (PCNA family)